MVKTRIPRALLIVFGAALTVACAGENIGEAKYAHDQCRRLALIDEGTGASIVGAEDFAYDRAGARLFVSAYDRRAVEKAARKNRSMNAHGGVYVLALSEIFDAENDELRVQSLVSSENIVGGLRPHGIDYDAENKEIVFINRTYVRRDRKWIMVPRVQRVGANGEMFVGEASPAHCAANDVIANTSGVYTSFDHRNCGWGAGFEDVFSLKRSGVVAHGHAQSSDQANRIAFERASFANGLTETLAGDIVLAATRENALLILKNTDETIEEAERFEVPGGPDNLTIGDDGGVVAATHPAMLRLALNRKLGLGNAPSRIVKADTDTGRIEILYDDKTGKKFSAATVGVETSDGLVVGSVTDEGLLVCEARS